MQIRLGGSGELVMMRHVEPDDVCEWYVLSFVCNRARFASIDLGWLIRYRDDKQCYANFSVFIEPAHLGTKTSDSIQAGQEYLLHESRRMLTDPDVHFKIKLAAIRAGIHHRRLGVLV